VYTSIRTRLRFFRSIFCSRRPLPQHSFPFVPNLPSLFPMSTQSPPLTRKSTTGPSQGVRLSPLYHIEWIDGAHGNVCVPRVSGSNFTLSSSQLLGYDWACMHPYPLPFFFQPIFGPIISREIYAGLGYSIASFFPFTLYSILLVDGILMVDILFFF
jgi:hypothetical protein